MIAYLDMPLPGTHKGNGHDILVLAIVAKPGYDTAIVYVDEGGDLAECHPRDVNLNWRFDNRSRKWLDVDTGEEEGGLEEE